MCESTFYLHMQNRSRQYFDIAREFANNLNTKSRVKCGFAALNDVTSGALDDRMDSFFISETLTYVCAQANFGVENSPKLAHSLPN